MKDIILPKNAPKILLLQKHADYIVDYASRKDEYVFIILKNH